MAYTRRSFAGGAISTTIPNGMGSGDTSFTVAAATGWSFANPFYVVVDRGLSTEEKMLCSGISGLVVSITTRGADSTSAVAHSAGCTVQVCHVALDDDEANQVVNGVFGQSGAAKGDILYMQSAAGPNTLSRLGVGTNSTSTLGVASGVPAWETSPGRLLATQQYAPVTLATYNLTTSLAAIDTSNATLAFTVPASGNVDVSVQAYIRANNTSGGGGALGVGLLNHSGGAQLGNTVNVDNSTGTVSLLQNRFIRFHLTGLTPGAFQVDFAAGVSTTTNYSGSVFAMGYTGNPNTSDAGPLLIQAFAA